MQWFDTHCHTELSDCAEDVSLEMYVDHALRGCHPFAVTDHSAHVFYPVDDRWGFWGDHATETFGRCYEAGVSRAGDYVRRLRDNLVPGMFAGIELDALPDGRPVFDEALLPTLDIVVGAVHGIRALMKERPDEEVTREFKMRFLRLCELGVHSLAHPFREWQQSRREVEPGLLEWLVDAAADAGVALELNCHYELPHLDVPMVQLCVERGVRLSIATDTHRAREFGDFRYHERILIDAGLQPHEWDGLLFSADALLAPG